MLPTEIVPPLLYRIEHIGALIILHYKIETTYVTRSFSYFFRKTFECECNDAFVIFWVFLSTYHGFKTTLQWCLSAITSKLSIDVRLRMDFEMK